MTIVPFDETISSSSGPAVISLDLASVAICASIRRCSQPQALNHLQRRLAAGVIERAPQELPVDCHNILNCLGKHRHELLKSSAELRWTELPEQPAEGIVTGQAILKLEKPAQERLLRFREQRRVHRTLTAAQGSCTAQSSRAYGTRAGRRFRSAGLPPSQHATNRFIAASPGVLHTPRVRSITPESGNTPPMSRKFQMRFPGNRR